jgi:O-antigen/teichoic acid export membrane protein
MPDVAADRTIQVDSAAAPLPSAPAGIERRVLRSVAWTVAGFALLQVLRFVCNIILTWFLARDVFGLMALVDVLILGLHFFSEVGVGTSVVRSERGEDPVYLNTAWTIQLLRGVGLWLAACALAWPVGAFFSDARLPPLLAAAGLTAVFEGAQSTGVFLLERRLDQRRIVLLQLTGYAVGMGVTVGYLIWVEHSAWALVVGRLVGSAFIMICTHLLLPGPRNRPHWDRTAARELLHFGKWIFLGTLCTFVADQADRLVVGKSESLGTLGVYNLAVQLCGAPKLLLYALLPTALLPLYSRLQRDGLASGAAYALLHPMAAGSAALLVSGLIAAGPTLVECLFRPEYHDAGWMLRLLAVGTWLSLLEGCGNTLLLAAGQPHVNAVSNAAKAVTLPLFGLTGLALSGMKGMIIGFVMADAARYVVTAGALVRRGLPVLRLDGLFTLGVVIVTISAVLVGQLPGIADRIYLRLLAESLGVVFPWTIVLAFVWRRFRGGPSVGVSK